MSTQIQNKASIMEALFDNEREFEDKSILLEKTARQLIRDIERTADSSIIAGLMLIVMFIICATPTEGFEELKNKISLSFPAMGTFLLSLFTAFAFNTKYALTRSKLMKYTREEVINGRININSILTVTEKLSLLRLLIYIRMKLAPNNVSDFDDEVQRVISAFMEH